MVSCWFATPLAYSACQGTWPHISAGTVSPCRETSERKGLSKTGARPWQVEASKVHGLRAHRTGLWGLAALLGAEQRCVLLS